MIRTSRILAALLLAVLTLGRPASADAGASDDPRDSGGAIDISRISHTNDDETANYRLETYEPFALGDVFQISWGFDFNNDGNASDACALMKRIGTTNILRASFYKDCGPETWGTADARVGERSIEFSLPLIDLVEGGGLEPSNGYGYQVTAADDEGIEDTAPEHDLVVHENVPAPTPRAGSADTQLGFQGDAGSATGAGGGARTAEQARADGPIDASEAGREGDQTETAGSSKGTEFRFGPVPVCSGSFCFALGVGAPALAAFIFVLVRSAVRRRNLSALSEATGRTALGDAGAEARSHPGNV